MTARLLSPWKTVLTHRDIIARVLAVIAVLLMIRSAVLFRAEGLFELDPPVPRSEQFDVFLRKNLYAPEIREGLEAATLSMLLGGLALAGAFWFSRRSLPPLPHPVRAPLCPLRSRWFQIWQGSLWLALAAEASGNWLNLKRHFIVSPHLQFALLCGGVILLIWQLGGLHWPPALPRVSRREGLLLIGITLLALGVRVWHLDERLRLFVDELNFATATWEFEETPGLPLVAPMTGIIAFPRLYSYWQTESIHLFGSNLASLRLISVIIGTLTIPALYLLARETFDRSTAAMAAFLLAVFPPHIHFSRLALNNIADPLAGTLAFALVARSLRTQRRTDYALAGAALGLTQYFYEGGRLLFPAIMLAWLIGGLLLWRPRIPWRGVIILIVAAVIVAMPIYYTLESLDSPLAARATDGTMLGREYWQKVLLSSQNQEELKQHLKHTERAFLIYIHERESYFYYGGETPLVLIYLAPALLLGIFVCLWRIRAPGPLLLLLWLLATVFANSLMIESAHSTRHVVVLPALMLLCAVGIRYPLQLIWPNSTRFAYLRPALMTVLMTVAAVAQITYYFGPHMDFFNFQLRHINEPPNGDDAVNYAADHFEPGTYIHLISDPEFHENYAIDMLNFLADDLYIDAATPEFVNSAYIWGLSAEATHAFFLMPDDTETLRLLRTYFVLDGPYYLPEYEIARDKQFVFYMAHEGDFIGPRP